MRIPLTSAFVANAVAATDKDRSIFWDVKLSGFGLQVTAAGHKSYVVQYRSGGRSKRMKVDGRLSLEQARKRARVLLGQVAHGGDPLTERRRKEDIQRNSLRVICEQFLAREGRTMRSADAWRRALERAVFPMLGSRPISELKRSDIARLLDHIEDERGPAASDTCLSILRRIMNWHAARSDDFRSPIVRGMSRQGSNARSRILNDEEIRAVWQAAGNTGGPFGAFVRLLLLTAARRNECAKMEWSEVSDGVWTLPSVRNKVKVDLARPLSGAAQAVLAELPRFHNSPFVFSYTGRTALRGFAQGKMRFDAQCGVTGWQLHDLRRTARSLMSRAGVPSEHAERCLGHVIPGVEGIYNRHAYRQEMLHAYERLAALIEQIVSPQENNVVALARR